MHSLFFNESENAMIKTVNDLVRYFDDDSSYANVIFVDASSYDFDKARCEAFHVDEYVNCESLKQKYSERIIDNYTYMYCETHNCINCSEKDNCYEREVDNYCAYDNIYVMFSIKN